LVERNLAKVEVESSRLFSRSSFKKGKLMLPFFSRVLTQKIVDQKVDQKRGAIAKRLCNGLQIRLARFDSGSRLHRHRYPDQAAPPTMIGGAVFVSGIVHIHPYARMVKLVDTSDLKSAATKNGIRVRFPFRAPPALDSLLLKQ
jgi:hypothetical protein